MAKALHVGEDFSGSGPGGGAGGGEGVADQNDTQVTIIDLQENLAPSIYEMGAIEESSRK